MTEREVKGVQAEELHVEVMPVVALEDLAMEGNPVEGNLVVENPAEENPVDWEGTQGALVVLTESSQWALERPMKSLLLNQSRSTHQQMDVPRRKITLLSPKPVSCFD